MTSDTFGIPERIDMGKLAKNVAIKSAQLIVQARDGCKVKTECNPQLQNLSLFNLAFREFPDVEREAKRALMTHSTTERWSLCIEIYLKTADGDVMTLETWNISLLADYCDTISVFTLYSRFGIIVKSLLAVTRVIPAYRYARKQNPESYTIAHKIYAGEPICNSLGDKYKQLKVGAVITPIGTWQLSVSYRTNMTISDQPNSTEASMIVKSDHFRTDFSPIRNRNEFSDENLTSRTDESKFNNGAFVESRRDSLIQPESDQLIPTVPFGSLLSTTSTTAATTTITTTTTAVAVAATATKMGVQQQPSPTNVSVNGNELCERLNNIEFDKDDANGNITVTKSASSNNDFIVVDLVKPPFAESSGNIELGTFYQEWKAAPPLQACPTDPKVIDQVGDLTSQLASYETSLKEFDSMVTSLCHETTNNNENTSISPLEL